ncbi:MAG: nuclear transport factor 2 family protein [Pyrinomonadaceae bacterium]
MKYLLTITILIIASAGSSAAQCSDADKKALEAFDAAWSRAGQNGDKVALMAIYADDYVGFPGNISKTKAVEDTMRTFEQNKANPSGADNITYDNYMVSCTPTTGTITHRNTVTNNRGGIESTFYSRSVHFLEKRGGKWQVVSNAGHGMDDFMVIGYMEQDWNNAALKRDGAWAERNLASGYTSIGSGSAALMNKQQDIADMVNGKAVVNWNELSDLNIRVDGNTAIVTGINHVKGKDDKGVPFDRKVRFTDTFIKRDGRWQAWATQGTRMPAP